MLAIVPGPRHRADRARAQPDGRRAARPVRPAPAAGARMTLLSGRGTCRSTSPARRSCATSTSPSRPGEILGVIGESGSGKSMTALAVMRLLPRGRGGDGARSCSTGGDLLALPEREMCALRGRDIGMIFQEPMTALNPLQTIGDQVAETVRRPRRPRPARGAARSRARRSTASGCRRRASRSTRYPHELSGGQRQRVVHRHGDRAAAPAADRRRADDGARRDHAGADPRPAAAARRRGRHGADAHHPRPRRGRRPRRPHRHHARRARWSRPGRTGGALPRRCGIPIRGRCSPRRASCRRGRRGGAGRRRCWRSRAWCATIRCRAAACSGRAPRFAPSTASASRFERARTSGSSARVGCGQVDAGARHPRRSSRSRAARSRSTASAVDRRGASCADAPAQDAGGVPGPLRHLQPAPPRRPAGGRAVPPARPARRRRRPRRRGSPRRWRRSG